MMASWVGGMSVRSVTLRRLALSDDWLFLVGSDDEAGAKLGDKARA